MIEYLEDAIDVDPSEEFPRTVRESGKFVYRTGDVVVDKWQEDAAAGGEVNFDEAFDPSELARFEKIKAMSRRRYQERRGVGSSLPVPAPETSASDDEFHDDYEGGR